MYSYFIILTIFKISFLYPYCEENQNNCLICDPLTKLCIRCSLEIFSPNEEGGCSPISKCKLGKNYCLQCDELGKDCINCEHGLYPDENGGCSFVNNCEISYKGYCLKCKNEFILIGTICKSLNLYDFLNCKKINNITGLCQECNEGFYLNNGDKKCSDIENCNESTLGKCSSCISGYYLNVKEEKCLKWDKEKDSLLFCKETLDGEICEECEDGYFFDKKRNCIGINYCAEKKEYSCEKCIEGYYFNKYKDSCVLTQNCYLGDRIRGICKYCNENFYLDLKDGKCKSNLDNSNFKYCEKAEGDFCISCNFPYYLSEDGKCSITKNCSEASNGTCISCSDGYYLGLDNRCSSVEHCIYSEFYEQCKECEDGYYYNITNSKCIKFTKGYENCRITSYNGDYCAYCKKNYYNNQSDHLCYYNNETNNFYKCSNTDETATLCIKCENNYHIAIKDNKCTNVEYCQMSDGEKCLQCEDRYCLDIKNNKCEINNGIISEDKKHFYKCKMTNEKGTTCESCISSYQLKNGLCYNNLNCIEKNENGDCLKCKNDIEYTSCLNYDFGCIYSDNLYCIECNSNELFKCTKCAEGYELNEKYECISSNKNNNK